MNKKYEFTDEKRVFLGHNIYLIRACRDIGNHKAGWIGGWIESEANLSQDGECWVNPGCVVMGDAQVTGDAKIYADSIVCGSAKVTDKAIVFGSTVTDQADISGEAYVRDSHVCGKTTIDSKANIRTSHIESTCGITGETRIDSSDVFYSGCLADTRLTDVTIDHCSIMGGQYSKVNMHRFTPPANACYSGYDKLDPRTRLIVCQEIKGDLGSLTYCPETAHWFLDCDRYLSIRGVENMIRKRFPDKIEAFEEWAAKTKLVVRGS